LAGKARVRDTSICMNVSKTRQVLRSDPDAAVMGGAIAVTQVTLEIAAEI
jgi:hypothetical protein